MPKQRMAEISHLWAEWYLFYTLFTPFAWGRNTPLKERTKDMIKILFVCWGNICRSPMAEFIMKKMVADRGIADKFVIESAAHTSEEIGNPVYPPARKELASHGISCEGKRARKMTKEDYDRWDYIIGMENLNLRYMMGILGGDPEGKVHLLMDFTGKPEDIDDPWYTGDFPGVYRQITRGCEALLEKIGY